MHKINLLVFAVCCCAVILGTESAFIYERILRVSYFNTDCLPMGLPQKVEVECDLNRTSQPSGSGNFYYCNCTDDKRLVLKWQKDPTTGLLTYVTNFSTNVCEPNALMYVSIWGTCGGGLAYDAYAAQQLETYIQKTQQGASDSLLSRYAPLIALNAVLIVWHFVLRK